MEKVREMICKFKIPEDEGIASYDCDNFGCRYEKECQQLLTDLCKIVYSAVPTKGDFVNAMDRALGYYGIGTKLTSSELIKISDACRAKTLSNLKERLG